MPERLRYVAFLKAINWLSRVSTSDSKLNFAVITRVLSARSTFRNITTVERLAAKYPLET
jgi:hypothetical protein